MAKRAKQPGNASACAGSPVRARGGGRAMVIVPIPCPRVGSSLTLAVPIIVVLRRLCPPEISYSPRIIRVERGRISDQAKYEEKRHVRCSGEWFIRRGERNARASQGRGRRRPSGNSVRRRASLAQIPRIAGRRTGATINGTDQGAANSCLRRVGH